MTTATTIRHSVRFVRSPKGLLLLLFAAFVLLVAAFQGFSQVARVVVVATATAVVVDVAITWATTRRWVFPGGAILTGLIIAMVLRPQEPALAPYLAAVAAIGSKHLLRTRWSNVFNPAAVGLVTVSLFLGSGQSWWGALPDLGVWSVILLLAGGIFIADHINKLPLVLSFLGAYFGLFTLLSFVSGSATVADVFRTPDAQAALFFVFFMVDDPPTCPVRYRDQVVFGGIAAAASAVIFVLTTGAVYYMSFGVLVANLWESGRRLTTQSVLDLGSTVWGQIRPRLAGSAAVLAVALFIGLLVSAIGSQPSSAAIQDTQSQTDAVSPPGSASSPSATATPGQTNTYTVQPGDTLLAIATKLSIAPGDTTGWINQVVQLNNLSSAADIVAGQQLRLPAGAGTNAAAQPTPVPTRRAESAAPEMTRRSTNTSFVGIIDGDTWRLLSRALPNTELDLTTSGDLVLIDADTEDVLFKASAIGRPSARSGPFQAVLDGVADYAGSTLRIDGNYQVSGSRVSISGNVELDSPVDR